MKYFGTDGIRGVYGEGITEDIAYRAGRALARLFGGRGIVGRDTRLSGPVLEGALAAGLTDGGADVCLAGILPTPAISYLTNKRGFSFGVEISASHNPPEYNGLKIFMSDGYKLPVSAQSALEYYMDDVGRAAGGGLKTVCSGEDEYLEYLSVRVRELARTLGKTSLEGMRILLDCGGGAACSAAARLFEELGAQTETLCADCRGECINVRCGALHPEKMCERAADFDMGASFDGDADRVVIFSKRLYGGDEVLYNLTRFYPYGTVVGTVMTNSALERKLSEKGMRLLRTDVGDRNVGELMRLTGAELGGDPSGPFILGGSAGDGILSAAACALLVGSGGLYRLQCDRQVTVNIPTDKADLSEKKLRDAENAARRLAERVVVRLSGTEPVVRIMAEGGDPDGAAELIRNALL